MADYIERNVPLDALKQVSAPSPSEAWILEKCIDKIEGLVSMDAAPVVHSKWRFNNDGSGTCQRCHRHTMNCWDHDSSFRYCPDCGAKMDGG